jgi:hypothetical protein
MRKRKSLTGKPENGTKMKSSKMRNSIGTSMKDATQERIPMKTKRRKRRKRKKVLAADLESLRELPSSPPHNRSPHLSNLPLRNLLPFSLPLSRPLSSSPPLELSNKKTRSPSPVRMARSPALAKKAKSQDLARTVNKRVRRSLSPE